MSETTSPNIILRPATAQDEDTVYHLMCELEQCEFDRLAFAKGYALNLANPNMHYALATQNNEVLGFISLHLQYHLHHVNWIAEIQELIITPQARGAGVGKRLLRWAEDTARELGAEQTELSTRATRYDAHRFYQREGYLHTHFRFVKPLSDQ